MPRRVEIRRPAVRDLRRRLHDREPKQRFVLFCEGAKTEPAYFDAIRRACPNTLIEVHGGVGVPMTVAQQAVAYAKENGLARGSQRRKDSFERNDQVWAVFDCDVHPQFKEAVELCERNGVGAAWSKPCFELWLILHEDDYGKPGTHQHVQKALETLRPEYDRRGAKIPDCDDMVGRVEDAERRGAMLLREREKDGSAPFGNPSTTVGRLTRAIREADRRARPPG